MANLAKQTIRQPGYAARTADAVRPHVEVLSTPSGIVRVFHLPVVKRTSDQPTIALLPTLLIVDGKPALLVQTQTPDEFQESHAYLRDTSGETAAATHDQLEKALAAHVQRFNQGDARYQMAFSANGATSKQNGGTWDSIFTNMKVKGNDRLRHALPLAPVLADHIASLEPIQPAFTPRRASENPEVRVAEKGAHSWKGQQVVITYSDHRGGIDYVADRKEGMGVTETAEAIRAFLREHGPKAGLPLVGEAPLTSGPTPVPRPHTKLKNTILANAQLTELIAGVAFTANPLERKRTDDGKPQVKLNSRDGRGGRVPLALIYADEKGLREGPIELKPGADADQTWEQLTAALPGICAELGIRLLEPDNNSGSASDPATTGATNPPPPNPPPSPLRQDSDFLRAVQIACAGWEGPIADGVRTLFKAVGTNDKASAAKAITSLITAAKPATTDAPTNSAEVRQLTERATNAEATLKLRDQTIESQRVALNLFENVTVPGLREEVRTLTAKLEDNPPESSEEAPEPDVDSLNELRTQIEQLKGELKTATDGKTAAETARDTAQTAQKTAEQALMTEQQKHVSSIAELQRELNSVRSTATTTPASFAELTEFFSAILPDVLALRALDGQTMVEPLGLETINDALNEATKREDAAKQAIADWTDSEARDLQVLANRQAAFAAAATEVNRLREQRDTHLTDHDERVVAWRQLVPSINDLNTRLDQLTELANAGELISRTVTTAMLADPKGWLTRFVKQLDTNEPAATAEDTRPSATNEEPEVLETVGEEPGAPEHPEPPTDEPPTDPIYSLCLTALWDDKGQIDLLRVTAAETRRAQYALLKPMPLGAAFDRLDGKSWNDCLEIGKGFYTPLGDERTTGTLSSSFRRRCQKAGCFDSQNIFRRPATNPIWFTQHNDWVDRIGLPEEKLPVPEAADLDLVDADDSPPPPPPSPVENRLSYRVLSSDNGLANIRSKARRDTGNLNGLTAVEPLIAPLGALFEQLDAAQPDDYQSVTKAYVAPLNYPDPQLGSTAAGILRALAALGLIVNGKFRRDEKKLAKLRPEWTMRHNSWVKSIELEDLMV